MQRAHVEIEEWRCGNVLSQTAQSIERRERQAEGVSGIIDTGQLDTNRNAVHGFAFGRDDFESRRRNGSLSSV
jgi:hypothetical protein